MTDETLRGEDSIIQEFLAPLAAGYPGAFGLKDDCAVIAPPVGHELVVKTDPVVEGVHFLPGAAPEDIAWRALAVNVSDLAGKGAIPIGYLMALALPEAPKRAWLERFASGLGEAQRAFGCHLIGGDTDCRPGPLTVAITVFGSVPAGQMVRRGTARIGDHLFVTGTLGDAALGLALLKDATLVQRLGLETGAAAELVNRFLRPQPRLTLRPLLLAHASAAMDLSDGLMKDCRRMCAASGVAARIEAAALPLSDPARKVVAKDAAWFQAVAAAGDDYEILVAVPGAKVEGFVEGATALGFPVTRIGEIRAGSGVRMEQPDGSEMIFERTGWDHF
ncbi:MAG: thiamine-phosphate kinase [Hyphomicrobiaceae bacterium]